MMIVNSNSPMKIRVSFFMNLTNIYIEAAHKEDIFENESGSEDERKETSKKPLPLAHSLSFNPNRQFNDIEGSEEGSISNFNNKRMNATSFIDARRKTGSVRRTTKGQWTQQEDEFLRNAVLKYEGKNWKKIAECLVGRTDVQ